MADYLNCFRYGCPPHGGFGLGLGRLLMILLGLESLREATFLFRDPTGSRPDHRHAGHRAAQGVRDLRE